MDGRAIALTIVQIARILPFDRLARKEPDWEQYKAGLTSTGQAVAASSVTLQPPANAPARSAIKTQQAKPASAAAPLPTTRETVDELKRRLGREMYRLQMDLVAGGRIAGKPCDCLEKHTEMGLLPMVEELVTMDTNPVYDRIIIWSDEHLPEFTVDAVSRNDPEHYRNMAPSIRELRKDLLGTEKLSSLVSHS
jgi:hypothetical protein